MIPSQISSLTTPADAIAARLELIDGASQTLDLQYYLWNSDVIGYLMLARVIEAADRGVRVRLLVDDMKFRRRTLSIASLCLHPNLEIRVFNSWRRRSGARSWIESIMRFRKLDHRMHNKLMIADGRRAIFGGRNLGDEHFGLSARFNLVDFDVLLESSEVPALSNVFAAYWDSPTSVSGASLDESVSDVDLDAARGLVAAEMKTRTPILTSTALAEREWDGSTSSETWEIDDDAITVAFDNPAISREAGPTEVIEFLTSAIAMAEREVIVVTPFFVPDEATVVRYRQLIERGVEIRILTNSLASNEGTISNSGLRRLRPSLLEAGVQLYELRTDAHTKDEWEIPPTVARYLGLHAKLYIIDREEVIIGSVNLDPRSKYINTEMAALVKNAEFAEKAAEAAVRLMGPDNAWEVDVDSKSRLRWSSEAGILHRQPARGPGQRVADAILSRLPISSYI
jgi:putative cardiolipin synthase